VPVHAGDGADLSFKKPRRVQPYLSVNFIIALQATFPSGN